MSNPEPSLDRSRRRHAGPLVGITLVVILAIAGLFWWLSYEAAEAPAPEGAEAQVDGRTGEESDADPAAVEVEPVPNPEAAPGNAAPDADIDDAPAPAPDPALDTAPENAPGTDTNP